MPTNSATNLSRHKNYDAVYKSRIGLAPGPVLALLGLLGALYFGITGGQWAVTGEFTRLGGHVLEWFGTDISHWKYYQEVTKIDGGVLDRPDGWIVVAMLAGSLTAALFAGDFRVRIPRLKRRLVQALFGGMIAGIGARMAYGCNLAALFTGIPQFTLSAWLFTLFTAIGTWVGVQIIRQRWWRGPNLPKPNTQKTVIDPNKLRSKRVRHRSIATIVLVGLGLATVIYLVTGQIALATAVVFGTAFGVLIQRGQICFTAAFRDLFVTGKTKLNDSVIIGLAVGVVATFVILLITGMEPITRPAGWGTIIGGFLFGIGIIMAGACETGMMYRAMEGQIAGWIAFAGNIVGATLLAYSWDHWGVYDTLIDGSFTFNFYSELNPVLGLSISLALLGIWWLLAARRRTSRRNRINHLADEDYSTTPSAEKVEV